MAKPKPIDQWIYAHKGLDQPEGTIPLVRDKKVVVEVFIKKEFAETDAPPHATRAVSFIAKCADPAIEIAGTDIELIRRGVWAALDERFAIKWERWYRVEIGRGYLPSGTIGSGLQFSYTDVERGIAWDGAELLREYNYRSVERYTVSPWTGVYRTDGGRILACVPVTPANTAALEEFALKIDALRNHLAGFFKPETIQQTLANLSGLALLAADDRAEGEPG